MRKVFLAAVASATVIGGVSSSALAGGGSVVAPNAFEAQSGNGGLNTITRNAGNPRTYQMLIDSSQLGGIPAGSLITGLGFRMFSTFAPWPPAGGANWTQYNIWMSTPATNVNTMSTTFANNVGANVTSVFDGPLSLGEGHFPAGGGAGGTNAFGDPINLMNSFLYPGGDLLIEFRHPGGTHADASGFLDGLTTTHSDYGIVGRAVSATGDQATVGAFSTLYITQIHWVPAPGALALLGLAGLAARRRRRA